CATPQSVNCTTLNPSTSDADWAEAMSLGEANFRVNATGLAHFVRAIGANGIGAHGVRIMRADTARALQAAMLDAGQNGTGTSVRDRLGALGRIGGKTGTGPANSNPHDGIFAALAFDARGAARFAVVTYVRGGGLGGGVPAQISAELAGAALSGQCP